MDWKPDNRVIKTYVWHKDKCFFVSTIERESSAMYYPTRYNETMVWEYDWEKAERGKLVHQAECSKGSVLTHQKIVETLYLHGIPEQQTEE